MLRRHGDILVGNGEGIVLRGRAGERHIRRSPLLEGNDLIALTFLFFRLDGHRVTRKEVSGVICMGDDTGAGERAVFDRHRIGLAAAVRGVAVGLIHIDCVVCVAEARSFVDGTAGVTGMGGVFFPLDLHLADLGQGRFSHRINAIAVSVIFSGVGHIDFNLTGSVDDYIIFCCIQTVAVITACRIVRRSAGDVH